LGGLVELECRKGKNRGRFYENFWLRNQDEEWRLSMFSDVKYCQNGFTWTNRWFTLSTLLLLVLVLNGCELKQASRERRGIQAIRFDEPNAINLEVNGETISERINTVKEYMDFLNDHPDVDFSSGFEQSRVMVRRKTMLDNWWQIDFHLVWPSTPMENQDFNLMSLLNWTACLEDAAPGDALKSDASTARNKAVDLLRDLTQQFAQKTGNRVRIVPPGE